MKPVSKAQNHFLHIGQFPFFVILRGWKINAVLPAFFEKVFLMEQAVPVHKENCISSFAWLREPAHIKHFRAFGG